MHLKELNACHCPPQVYTWSGAPRLTTPGTVRSAGTGSCMYPFQNRMKCRLDWIRPGKSYSLHYLRCPDGKLKVKIDPRKRSSYARRWGCDGLESKFIVLAKDVNICTCSCSIRCATLIYDYNEECHKQTQYITMHSQDFQNKDVKSKALLPTLIVI